MAYIKKIWKDYPDTSTPIKAEALQNIEDGIEALDTSLSGGWINANETWVYASVDDPTGVITISGDKTTKYSLGMRIKFTNATNVIYGIITAISYSSPNTTMTFLHEIDPTDSLALHLMVDSAITNNYYSSMKAPYGFPLNETYWQVIVSNATTNYINNPTADTWYNNNSMQLKVPIGMWKLGYKVYARSRILVPSSVPYLDTFVTLSTTANTETLPKYTAIKTFYATGLADTTYDNDCYYNFAETHIVTTPTIFYLLIKYKSSGMPTLMGFAGSTAPTDIKATIAYL